MEDILENDDEQLTEDTDDIWSLLNIPDPGPEPYEDRQEEADEELAKDDKMVKKLSAKMDNMQKKFEASMMRERINKFQEGADDLEKSLFKTIAADVKDIETLDKAIGLVHERSTQMKAEAEKYREQLEAQAQEQVGKAWGTGPIGTPTPKSKDYDEELMARIQAGDVKAAFEGVVGDDWPTNN